MTRYCKMCAGKVLAAEPRRFNSREITLRKLDHNDAITHTEGLAKVKRSASSLTYSTLGWLFCLLKCKLKCKQNIGLCGLRAQYRSKLKVSVKHEITAFLNDS